MFEHFTILDVSFFGFVVMSGSCGMFVMPSSFVVPAAGSVGFAQLPGAIGTVELMALAGHANQGNGH